jgi:hypothetical protein
VDGLAPRLHHRLDLLQRGVLEQRVQALVQPPESAQGTGHDDQAPAGADHRAERAQHRVRAAVRHVDELVRLLLLGQVRRDPGGGVRHHDVDAAVLLGELRRHALDRAGVGDVQPPALDAGDRRGRSGGARGGLGDTGPVASGEQDQVLGPPSGGEPFDERVADALVGSGDQSDALGRHTVETRHPRTMRPTRLPHSWYA